MKMIISISRQAHENEKGPQKTTGAGVSRKSKHLCVLCALIRHDFEERAPSPEDTWDTVPSAKARIDGLPYRSVYHVGSRGVDCTDCGERVLMTYDPEYVNEHLLAVSGS